MVYRESDCKKCVVSNQRPNSTIEFKSSAFDKKGINIDENEFVMLVIITK